MRRGESDLYYETSCTCHLHDLRSSKRGTFYLAPRPTLPSWRVESADLRGMRFSPGGDSLYFLGFFRPPGTFAARLGGTSMALQFLRPLIFHYNHMIWRQLLFKDFVPRTKNVRNDWCEKHSHDTHFLRRIFM